MFGSWFKKKEKMDIKYDKPFQVTEKQYNALISNGGSSIGCHRKDEEGNYWFKLWLMEEKKFVIKILQDNAA